MTDLIKPAALRPGDVIGVVSPSGAFAGRELCWPILREYLEGLGYGVKFGPNARRMKGYLAGSDEERLSDLHTLWADLEVTAIFSSQGGYGSMRLLDKLDYDLFRRNPKILMGYSDTSALLLSVHARSRLVVFHGPQAISDFGKLVRDPFTMKYCWEILTGQAGRSLSYRFENAYEDDYQTLRPGVAEGPLIVTNLQLLASLMGTGYPPDLSGCVLMLEDVGLPIYILDRMLTQLRLSGVLDRLAGIIFGEFVYMAPGSPLVPLNLVGAPSVPELLASFVSHLRIPVGYGFACGHTEQKATFPVGVRVRFEAENGALHLLEPYFSID